MFQHFRRIRTTLTMFLRLKHLKHYGIVSVPLILLYLACWNSGARSKRCHVLPATQKTQKFSKVKAKLSFTKYNVEKRRIYYFYIILLWSNWYRQSTLLENNSIEFDRNSWSLVQSSNVVSNMWVATLHTDSRKTCFITVPQKWGLNLSQVNNT